jgi:hypothetical protein
MLRSLSGREGCNRIATRTTMTLKKRCREHLRPSDCIYTCGSGCKSDTSELMLERLPHLAAEWAAAAEEFFGGARFRYPNFSPTALRKVTPPTQCAISPLRSGNCKISRPTHSTWTTRIELRQRSYLGIKPPPLPDHEDTLPRRPTP